jgi:tetratricopeptide (TPR) repeat protein
MQDALFVFFGLLALFTLIKYKSRLSLIGVVLLLMLSLLSKESGLLFVVASLAYLLKWDRKRILSFIVIIFIPLVAYAYLHINAVGLASNPKNAPIDDLSLSERLINAPSILLFYITKTLFPLKLAYGYFWVHSSINIRHFFLPLVIDVSILSAIVYLGIKIRKAASKTMYNVYLFFTVWIFIGFMLIMQIIPLDFTVSEVWFYFTFIGFLGLVGVVASTFKPKIQYRTPIAIGVIIIIAMLGARTFIRGFDWKSQDSLIYAEINANADDYTAFNLVAQKKLNQGDIADAKNYALKSIAIYPLWSNYNTLGNIYAKEYNYEAAYNTYKKGLHYGQNNIIYENLCQLTLVYGNPAESEKFLVESLKKYPADANIWLYFALFEQTYKNNKLAKAAISQAAIYGEVPPQIYDSIMNNQPFTVNLSGLNKTISI